MSAVELKLQALALASTPAQLERVQRQLRKKREHRFLRQKPTDKLDEQISGLDKHRHSIRIESRAVNLARIFLRGKSYSFAETSRRAENEKVFQDRVIPKVATIINRHAIDERHKDITDEIVRDWARL